jgi:hypothetical protein
MRARKASGEIPKTNPKPRDTAQGGIPFFSPQGDSWRDGFRIRAAASSSGQSAGWGVALMAIEKSKSTASRQLLSARRAMESASATRAIPEAQELPTGSRRLSTTAPVS